ncbi:MAG: hypothetical protein JSW64_13735 [Candidatus Zixiibacteriota bacterium]|nr:MAG: hypothetical protein JSW64_13735 [candidate division Zixibacteria bacterium]
MKKFFPLCLLLIIALVWTVSIAGDIDRTVKFIPEETVKVKKAQTAIEQPAVVQKQAKEKVPWEAPAVTRPADRTPTATSGEAEKAARLAAERAGEITVVPIVTGERTPSARRIKDIKADGVISSDERALYEELLSTSAPGVELPTPLNIVYESEVNDSCHLADPIACGDTVWCADLAYGTDDNDWYTFTLTDAQQVTIETHAPAAGVCDPPINDTWLELWTEDCQTMLAYDDDGGVGMYSLIVMNLAAGTYAINSDATHWGGQTGSYHLSLLCDPVVPVWYCMEDPPFYTVPPGKTGGGNGDLEPNNNCAEASRAMCEYAYCGALSSDNDVDWYYVDIPADTSYSLHIRVFADDTPNQYAQGGGCDPWVGLYASDCVTLIAANEDYYGTFPDAETYDSQIDPTGYPNCFNPGDRVYIQILTNYYSPGPYLLIINCEPCEIPQQGCDQDSLTIEITADNYPEEVTWDVVDQSTSQVVCSGGPYPGTPSGTVITEVCCLDSTGCYDFNIYDAYGDGGGPYDLYFNGVLFYSSDGDYGTGESVLYIGNGCPEPTGACCVGITCVATVTQDSCNVLGGDWFIDEDCSTFVCPYGACCLGDATCTATTNEDDCHALGGFWYANETCPEFQCIPVTSCDTAIYHNGDPLGGAMASQCDPFWPMAAETADDFILPGAGPISISEVVSWMWHWNGPPETNPADYLGINVTIYANDTLNLGYPAPAGKPIHGDTLCQHMELIPGGIIYTVELAPGQYTYVPEGGPMWRLMLPICVTLEAGETYWIAVEPILSFAAAGQTGAVPTTSQTGNSAEMIFELLGINVWTPFDPAEDIAFCLIEAPPVVWSCIEEPCMYTLPDNKQPGGVGDIEPNDDCAIASDALCEYAYCGVISTDNDHDWYRVIIPEDDSYGLHVRVFGDDTPNQYAQGGGLDPWVGLYKSDCVTLVASNDDYVGTFPDAEMFDSQLDPGGANCFFPGDTVYIEIMTPWESPGPYLLIINCVPCVVPTGACCVDTACVATNYQFECDALQGTWFVEQDCENFIACAPSDTCDETAVYHNGLPVAGGDGASQCAYTVFAAADADDFVLPGADSVKIVEVISWLEFFNPGGQTPLDFDAVNVTIYANDAISDTVDHPAGKPIDQDPDCGHVEIIPGGIIYTTEIPFGGFQYTEDDSGQWRMGLPVDVMLLGGEKYWLEVEPLMTFPGQTAWVISNTTGTGQMIFEGIGYLVWTERDVEYAFCLFGPAGCDYIVGDVNGSNSHNGLDVTYGVNYFKGIGPDPVCPDCPLCPDWFYCGDVNGSCSYNGLDVTYNVNYFKGIGPDPVGCDDCPQVGGPAADNRAPETPSVIKTKPVFEQKPGTK